MPLLIKRANLPEALSLQVDSLLCQAGLDPYLGMWVQLDRDNHRYLVHQDQLVGLISPRVTSYRGLRCWRTGSTYLEPGSRGQGLMARALREFYATRNGVAWIDDENQASINLFTGLGFIKDQAKASQEGIPGHWYIKTI